MTTQEMIAVLDEMRTASAVKNKRGMAFILASVFIWAGILVIHLQPINIAYKNLFTWYAVAFLMPFALLFTKLLKLKLKNEDNPLNNLGLLFTINEAIYILIVCWVCSAVPEKMVMVLAMVFGAHLLPFGWLYKSKSYTVLSGVITVCSLVVGCLYSSWVVALLMLIFEVIFAGCLYLENRK